jgi:hypothetical protein
MSRTSLGLLALALLSPATTSAAPPSPSASSASSLLKLHATLVALPKAPRCEGRPVRVTTLYRVERILEGRYRHRTIPVVQRCPEMARGSSRHVQGDAGPLRPGQTHLLTLRPFATDTAALHDPFSDDKRPRYEALRTDHSDWPPRIVVVVAGGGGTQLRLAFDSGDVVVGRATDADVLLSDRTVAPRHLQLSVRGDRIEVRSLSTSGSDTLLNGKTLARPRRITFRDRIQIGPYILRAALFLDGGDDKDGD